MLYELIIILTSNISVKFITYNVESSFSSKNLKSFKNMIKKGKHISLIEDLPYSIKISATIFS